MDSEIQRFLIYLALFGLLLILIFIIRMLNQKKSVEYRLHVKEGPVVDRFTDPGKAMRADEVYSIDEAKTKAVLWWDRSGITEGICGVCNESIKSPGGYLISRKMILQSDEYLRKAIVPLMKFGLPDTEATKQIRDEIGQESAPWLVCDHCIPLFGRY